jgi:hypothetical protein
MPLAAGSEGITEGGELNLRLLVEPDVFRAPLVVDAVRHDRQPLHPGLPAGSADRIEQNRPHCRFSQ